MRPDLVPRLDLITLHETIMRQPGIQKVAITSMIENGQVEIRIKVRFFANFLDEPEVTTFITFRDLETIERIQHSINIHCIVGELMQYLRNCYSPY